MAYVREPNPQPYFRDSVIAHKSTKNNASTQTTMCPKDTIPLSLVPDHIEQTADPNNSIQPSHHKPVRRSSRQRQCPERFGIPVELSHSSLSSDSDGYHKIKRILGIRCNKGSSEYLVQIRGEPAQQAIWVPLDHFDTKTKAKVLSHPLLRQVQAPAQIFRVFKA